MPGIVRLHRVMTTTPEKIYRAFLDPDAYARWLPPNGFTARVHAMDAKVGGRYQMSFTNFTTGNGHSFGGEYVELKPGYLGWQESLLNLARLVEPDIPD